MPLQLNDKEAADLASYIKETQQLLEQTSQAGAAPVLDKVAVDQTVDNLINAGFDRKENREKLAGAIMQDPKQLLGILNKIAGLPKAGTLPTLGKVAGDQTPSMPSVRESDRFFESRFPAGR
jgi:hypothetical protein